MSKPSWIGVSLVVACASGLLALRLAAAENESKDKKEPKDRLFELRTYTAVEGKLDALHARFRDHTNKLFEKHGMTIIGYWTPTDEPKSKNTLIYVLAFPDRESRDKAFREFASDPDWQKARAESERNGKLVDKVESVFLKATDYSPMR
jgi:hypothetical protein